MDAGVRGADPGLSDLLPAEQMGPGDPPVCGISSLPTLQALR